MADEQLTLVQMSGRPGSEKSAVAFEVGQQLPAVVLDYDVTKTGLLDAGVTFEESGHFAYETNYALARQVLSQGWNVA